MSGACEAHTFATPVHTITKKSKTINCIEAYNRIDRTLSESFLSLEIGAEGGRGMTKYNTKERGEPALLTRLS